MTKDEWLRLKGYWYAKQNAPKMPINACGKKTIKSKAKGTGQILEKSFIKSSSLDNPPLKGTYKTVASYSFIAEKKSTEDSTSEKPFQNFNSKKVTIKTPKEHGQYKFVPHILPNNASTM